MGSVCSCENSNVSQLRTFKEREIAMIIKIQSMVRVKLAKNKTQSLKRSHSTQPNNVFCKYDDTTPPPNIN